MRGKIRLYLDYPLRYSRPRCSAKATHTRPPILLSHPHIAMHYFIDVHRLHRAPVPRQGTDNRRLMGASRGDRPWPPAAAPAAPASAAKRPPAITKSAVPDVRLPITNPQKQPTKWRQAKPRNRLRYRSTGVKNLPTRGRERQTKASRIKTNSQYPRRKLCQAQIHCNLVAIYDNFVAFKRYQAIRIYRHLLTIIAQSPAAARGTAFEHGNCGVFAHVDILI